jgi:hypothetical protein
VVSVNLLVTALGVGVAGAGVVVVVAAGTGVVVEEDRGGGVELEEVMFVGAHKAEGPEYIHVRASRCWSAARQCLFRDKRNTCS